MENALMRSLFICQTLFIVTLNFFVAGCGGDDGNEAELDSLYQELVGTYELFLVEFDYGLGNRVVVEPPDITGRMTISSDREITQTIEAYTTIPRVRGHYNLVVFTGSFELFPDEEIIEIGNKAVNLISRPTYTWDGSILTTFYSGYMDVFTGIEYEAGVDVEKYFWRKI